MLWRQFALAAVALTGTVALQESLPQRRATEGRAISFNEGAVTFSAQTLRFISFGYERMTAAALWLRFLQNTHPVKVSPNEVSWLYLDLEAITELDPEFLPAYQFGGMFISVITEDRNGAEKILRKGMERFPQNWKLPAYLAYHFQFELNDPDGARPLYLRAAQLPGSPDVLKSIAASIQSKQSQGGLAALEELERNATSPELKKRIQEKLRKAREGNDRGR